MTSLLKGRLKVLIEDQTINPHTSTVEEIVNLSQALGDLKIIEAADELRECLKRWKYK